MKKNEIAIEKKPSVMVWLFAACLCAVLLPDLAVTVGAAKTEGAFSTALSVGIGLGAACISLLFLLRAVYLRFGKEGSFLPGVFPCLLVYLIFLYGSEKAVPILAVVYGINKGIFAGIAGIVAVVLMLFLGIFFFCWMSGSRTMPLKHPARRFFTKIYLGLPMSVLLWAAILAAPFLEVLMRKLWEEPPALVRHLMLVAASLIMAGLLNGAMALAEKMMAGAELSVEGNAGEALAENEMQPEKDAGKSCASIGEPLQGAGDRLVTETVGEPSEKAAGELLPDGEKLSGEDGERQVAEAEKPLSDAAAAAAAAGNGHKPQRKYIPHLIALLLCVILFLSQNMTQLTGNEAAMLNAELKESLIEYGFYLAASDIGGAAGIAEEAVEQMDSALLKAEEAVEEAERNAEEEAGTLRKAEKTAEKLEKVCSKYDIFRIDGKALGYLEKYKLYGGADEKLVDEALTLSEENLDSLWVQYTAALLGSSLTYDGAKHYDRTANAILRCGDLYQKEKNPSEDEWVSFEKNMAQMLYKVYHEDEAAEILTELMETDGGDVEVCELLVQCYDRSGEQEKAFELAAEYCEKGEDSPYLMYYAALSALKLEKVEECLTYTSELASYTAACEGDDLNECDTWLFELLEFLSLNDDSQYTEFQYDIYKELTEEENAIIDANPFFRNYLDAAYMAYHFGNNDKAEDALKKMEAVLSENQGLASAWYLCGIIASNTEEEGYGEDAIAYYQRAGELNGEIPAVWYAMAREYDKLEEYEKGIEACKKALSLLPEQDHGTDWYGINYHCSRLLQSLQAEVKK